MQNKDALSSHFYLLTQSCLNSTVETTFSYWRRKFGFKEGFIGPVKVFPNEQ